VALPHHHELQRRLPKKIFPTEAISLLKRKVVEQKY